MSEPDSNDKSIAALQSTHNVRQQVQSIHSYECTLHCRSGPSLRPLTYTYTSESRESHNNGRESDLADIPPPPKYLSRAMGGSELFACPNRWLSSGHSSCQSQGWRQNIQHTTIFRAEVTKPSFPGAAHHCRFSMESPLTRDHTATGLPVSPVAADRWRQTPLHHALSAIGSLPPTSHLSGPSLTQDTLRARNMQLGAHRFILPTVRLLLHTRPLAPIMLRAMLLINHTRYPSPQLRKCVHPCPHGDLRAL